MNWINCTAYTFNMKRLLTVVLALISTVGSGQIRYDSVLNIVKDVPARSRVDTLLYMTDMLLDGPGQDMELAYLLTSEAARIAKTEGYEDGHHRALALQAHYLTEVGEINAARRAFVMAEKLKVRPENLTYTWILHGNLMRSIANHDSAYLLYNLALKTIDQGKNHKWKGYLFRNLGVLNAVRWKNDTAFRYFEESARWAQETGNTRQLAATWLKHAEALMRIGRLREAEEFMVKGCEFTNESNNKYRQVECNSVMGYFYLRIGEYRMALSNLMQAQHDLQSYIQPGSYIKVYQNIGDVYVAMGENSIAINFFIEALKLAERQKALKEISELKASLAWIHKNQMDYAKSEKFVLEALEISKQIGDDMGEALCYNILGVLYTQQLKYDEGQRWLEQSMAIRRRINYNMGVSACLYNLATIFEARGQLTKALDLQLESLQLERQTGNHFDLGLSFCSIAGLLTKLKRYDEAETYLKKAEVMEMLTKSKILRVDVTSAFAAYYEARGDLKKALEYQKKLKIQSDSLVSESSLTKVAEMEALYELNKKNLEIESLIKIQSLREKELDGQRNQIKLQRALLIAVLIILVSVTLLAITSYRYSRKLRMANFEINEQKEEIMAQSEELIEANQTIAMINTDLEKKVESRTTDLRLAFKELDTFFYRSSHDFRRPLTTFMGLAEVAKVTVKDQHALELFDKVRITAQNLDKMLFKLQSISDVGSHEMVLKTVFIPEIITRVLVQLQDAIKGSGIGVVTEFDPNTVVIGYPAMIKIIIENILENAIVFNSLTNPFIHIKTYMVSGEYVIEIADNGEGIPAEFKDRIFEMYFRGSERSKGNGLGLYIVKKALEKLGARMEYRSKTQEGSIFLVYLPAETI